MDSFNSEFKDEPISYFPLEEESQVDDTTSLQSSLFLGCPRPFRLSLWLIITIVFGIYYISTFYISNILLIPMQVEGASMYPTLNYEYSTTNNIYANDVVYLYKTSAVEYKDIVVFNANSYDSSSNSEALFYIKRVIAVGGDTLQFKKVGNTSADNIAKFVLYKNGELLEEPYTAGDMLYNVKSEKFSDIITEKIITIPENHIYVLGDNRNNSKDSRELGPIHIQNIVGRVFLHVPYGHTLIYGFFNAIKNGYLF